MTWATVQRNRVSAQESFKSTRLFHSVRRPAGRGSGGWVSLL